MQTVEQEEQDGDSDVAEQDDDDDDDVVVVVVVVVVVEDDAEEVEAAAANKELIKEETGSPGLGGRGSANSLLLAAAVAGESLNSCCSKATQRGRSRPAECGLCSSCVTTA